MSPAPKDPSRRDWGPSPRPTYNKDLIAYGLIWPLIDYLFGQDWRTNGPIDSYCEFNDQDSDEKDPTVDARLIAERYEITSEDGEMSFYSDISLIIEVIIEAKEKDFLIERILSENPKLRRALSIYKDDIIIKREVAYGFGSDETISISFDTKITTINDQTLWRSQEDGGLGGERVELDDWDMDYIGVALRNFNAPQELLDALVTIKLK